MSSGSNIELESEAVGTMNAGAIDFTNDGLHFSTSTGSDFSVAPGVLGATLGVSNFVLGLIHPGTSWTVGAGAVFTYTGRVDNSGTLTLMPEADLTIMGIPLLNDIAYTQIGASSATYLHGGSSLGTPEDKGILIDSGIFATV